MAELNGADRKMLNYLMATLLVLRIAHVEVGLRGQGTLGLGTYKAGAILILCFYTIYANPGVPLGRPIGYYGTQGIMAGLAGWGTWLVKGYWGY